VRTRFVVGVDLGQSHDFTAMVVLERAGDELHARHIERLPLGMSYPDQVERIAALVCSAELELDALVAVDGTGVGRAVVDLLRKQLGALHAPLVAVTITGGATASRAGSRWSVPKRDLIAAAQVAIQAKRLKIASALSAAQILTDELTGYRITINNDGHDAFGNGRDAPHDDLVLALAIATYVADRPIRRTRITHVGLDESLERAMAEAHAGVIGNGIFR
jgi:hypothetical protein